MQIFHAKYKLGHMEKNYKISKKEGELGITRCVNTNMFPPNDEIDHCDQEVVGVTYVPLLKYSFTQTPWKSIKVCGYSDQLCISWPFGIMTSNNPLMTFYPISVGVTCVPLPQYPFTQVPWEPIISMWEEWAILLGLRVQALSIRLTESVTCTITFHLVSLVRLL